MPDHVLTVGDLRIAGIVGSRVSGSVEGICNWLPIGYGAARSDIEGSQPHLVLIELGNSVHLDRDRVDEVFALAHRLHAPTVLWLTDQPLVAPVTSEFVSELLTKVDIVFSTDPMFRGPSQAIDRSSNCLPHAASHEALSATISQQQGRIGLLVEALIPWRQQVSRRVERILRAATSYALSILAFEPVPADVPAEFADIIQVADTEAARVPFLAGCAALVAGSPPGASRMYVQAVVLDAVAMGVAVIADPSPWGGLVVPRIVASPAPAGPSADDLLQAALDHGEFGAGRRQAGMAIARNEHTYGHRLASIASSLSIPVMPVGHSR